MIPYKSSIINALHNGLAKNLSLKEVDRCLSRALLGRLTPYAMKLIEDGFITKSCLSDNKDEHRVRIEA